MFTNWGKDRERGQRLRGWEGTGPQRETAMQGHTHTPPTGTDKHRTALTDPDAHPGNV